MTEPKAVTPRRRRCRGCFRLATGRNPGCQIHHTREVVRLRALAREARTALRNYRDWRDKRPGRGLSPVTARLFSTLALLEEELG